MKSVEETVAPLTFDIKESLLERVASFQKKAGARSLSDVVRYAIGSFDFGEFEGDKPAHRQLSVRLPAEQKETLLRASRLNRVSVGELLRAALDALPNNPPSGFTTNQTQHIAMVAKKKPAKKVAKKPAKKVAKKAAKKPAKKACAKKCACKAAKKPAKKAVKKAAKKK